MNGKDNLYCSFCSHSEKEVPVIAKGLRNDAHICVHCVAKIVNLLPEQFPLKENLLKKKESEMPADFPYTPKEIKHFLDTYVVGQEQAKQVLAIAVYNHHKRLEILKYEGVLPDDLHEVEIEKSNVLIVGPTGMGKTLLAKTIARLLHVPFTIADATVFTEAGYVGEDVESILARLLQVCNYDVALAERGIVYIDEIDKLARKSSDNPSITKDVGGEGVQQALLKLLEGGEVLVPPQGGRKHPDQKMIKINTQNILFICGGAFEGIEKVIARRMNTHVIGFNSKLKNVSGKSDWLRYITIKDLKNFGIIPELLGRLPVVTYLESLDKKTLKEILVKPKNAVIRQYQKLFILEGITLEVQEGALDAIVEKAIELGTGARGLRNICEKVLRDYMFHLADIKDKKIILTKAYVKKQLIC